MEVIKRNNGYWKALIPLTKKIHHMYKYTVMEVGHQAHVHSYHKNEDQLQTDKWESYIGHIG